MTDFVFRDFPDQGYCTIFDRDSGLFVRAEEEGYPEPSWAEHGPELLDVSLTGHCSRGCAFCYRESSVGKPEMPYEDYEVVLQQAAEIGVLQIALGGGNPNEYSRFLDVVRCTREDYGIVPSYSTNGLGLTGDIVKATKDYCGAVAVSYYGVDSTFTSAVQKFADVGIKPNVHFVLTKASVDTAIDWLNDFPKFLTCVNAIIFLSYKPVGRGKRDLLITDRNKWAEFFSAVAQSSNVRVGFDSCSSAGVSELVNRGWDSRFYDACEAARFSAFVSEQLLMFPCSFMEKRGTGIDLHHNRMIDAWKHGADFLHLRFGEVPESCGGCPDASICKGGCNIFPEINSCPRNLDVLQLTG